MLRGWSAPFLNVFTGNGSSSSSSSSKNGSNGDLELRLWKLLNSDDRRRDAEALAILRSSKTFDINYKNRKENYLTFLHVACSNNRYDMLVELLNNTRIDPNQVDAYCRTPLLVSCIEDSPKIISLFVNNPKCDINKSDLNGDIPLMQAAFWGLPASTECILTSLRRIDLKAVNRAIEKARYENNRFFTDEEMDRKTGVADLLERYRDDPFDVVKCLRFKWKLEENGPVSLFVHVVLLCDGYFRLDRFARNTCIPTYYNYNYYRNRHRNQSDNDLSKIKKKFTFRRKKKDDPSLFDFPSELLMKAEPPLTEEEKAKIPLNPRVESALRFFIIMQLLPMDLQMVICNRYYDLPGNIIRSSLIDKAVKFMITDRLL